MWPQCSYSCLPVGCDDLYWPGSPEPGDTGSCGAGGQSSAEGGSRLMAFPTQHQEFLAENHRLLFLASYSCVQWLSLFFLCPGLLRTCQIAAEGSRQRAQKTGRSSAPIWNPGCQRDPAGPGGKDAGDEMNSSNEGNRPCLHAQDWWNEGWNQYSRCLFCVLLPNMSYFCYIWNVIPLAFLIMYKFLLLRSLYPNRLNVIFAAQIPHHLVSVFLFWTVK